MWLIDDKSAAYRYEIPDNDIFYIVASSGIYPDQSDIFDDVTTNWIGRSWLRRLALSQALSHLFWTLRRDAMGCQVAPCLLLGKRDGFQGYMSYMHGSHHEISMACLLTMVQVMLAL